MHDMSPTYGYYHGDIIGTTIPATHSQRLWQGPRPLEPSTIRRGRKSQTLRKAEFFAKCCLFKKTQFHMWVYDHEISYGLCYMVKQTDYIYKYAILTVIQCYELLFMIMNYNELYIYYTCKHNWRRGTTLW